MTPNPCARRTRYKTEATARAHWRASGKDVISCQRCGGWHLIKREGDVRAPDKLTIVRPT